MPADIHYLRWTENDRADQLKFDILAGPDAAGEITPDEFDQLYEHVGTDPDATLEDVYARWNRGSGIEADAFRWAACHDCGVRFDTCSEAGVAAHQEHIAETDHDIEDGRRSLSVGDIVVIDEQPHLVAPFGFEELDLTGDEVPA